MNPKPFAPVCHQSSLAELAEMAGHVRLGSANSVSEFTYAKLLVLQKEQEAAEACVMRDRCEKGRWQYIHENEYTGDRI